MQGNLKSLAYAVGQIVFAKSQGFQPWPARIKNIWFGPIKDKQKDDYIYCVSYFGSTSTANHHEDELKPFSEETYKQYQQKYKNGTKKVDKQIINALKIAWDKYKEAMESGTIKPASLYQPILYEQTTKNVCKDKHAQKSKSQLSKSLSKHKKIIPSKDDKKSKSMTNVADLRIPMSKDNKKGKLNNPKIQSKSHEVKEDNRKIAIGKNAKILRPKSNKPNGKQNEHDLDYFYQKWSQESKRGRLQKKKLQKQRERLTLPPEQPVFRIFNQEKGAREDINTQSFQSQDFWTKSSPSESIEMHKISVPKTLRQQQKEQNLTEKSLKIVKNQRRSEQYVKIEHKDYNNIDSSTDELQIGFDDYSKLTRTLDARASLIRTTSQSTLCSLAKKYLDTMTYQLSFENDEETVFKVLSMKKKQTLMAIFQGRIVTLNELLKANTLHSMFNFISAFRKSKSFLIENYEVEYHYILPTLHFLLERLNRQPQNFDLNEEKKAQIQSLRRSFNALGTESQIDGTQEEYLSILESSSKS